VGIDAQPNDAAVQYTVLQREVDTNRQLYDTVLKAMKDVGVLAEAQTSNVSIIDRAEPSDHPSSPNPVQAMLFAVVLGFVGAIGAAFALDYLDNTFKTADEVEHYLRLPTLAVVPEFARNNGQLNGPGNALATRAAADPSLCREVSAPQAHDSVLVEAYRHFRTALMLSRAGSPPKTTLITSAVPQEGKTVTAVNAAVMFAQLGSKVLLVDADLRRPRCHQFFAMENRLGLADVLTGAGSLEDIIRPTAMEHLYFLAAGSSPPNPTELLGSGKMIETLKHLEGLYDYIVIDSAPVIPVSDAMLLSTMVDGVALVTDGSQTPKQQVRAACSRLEYARAKILGVVLNKAALHSNYYHYYGYGSYYSDPEVDVSTDGQTVG
jgi:capsular exopolysaccharide synthesis family protein